MYVAGGPDFRHEKVSSCSCEVARVYREGHGGEVLDTTSISLTIYQGGMDCESLCRSCRTI